jgi:hypothetical protein
MATHFNTVRNSRAFLESSSTESIDRAIFDEIRKMLPGMGLFPRSNLGCLAQMKIRLPTSRISNDSFAGEETSKMNSLMQT